MSNKDLILKDIQQHNDAQDMYFEKWMMWGVTQIALMTAMILDNMENMEHKAESGLTDEMMEHYKKLAEHYNGGAHEPIQDTDARD